MGNACLKCITRITVKDASTMTEGVPLLSVDEQYPSRSELRSRSNISKRASSLETALQLVQRAVTEDKQRNYNEALSLYQHALVYFLESINYETESEKVKEKILAKCKQYLERAEKIAEYLNSDKKKRPTPAASLSGSTGKLASGGVTNSSPDSGSDMDNVPKSSAQGVKGAVGKVFQSIANHKLNGTLPSMNTSN